MGTAPTTLTVGQTYQFTATVTNTTNTAVTWMAGGVTGGNATAGTISGTGLYTAPAMVPTPTNVTIMATSQADTTKSASASVGINISLTLNLTSTSVQVTGTQQFTATLLGSANTAVTWTVNAVAGGNSTVGTISSTGLYTAPQTPPTPNTVTITATSVGFGSMSASCTVTVAPPPITVVINPSVMSLQTSGTLQFSAQVTTSGSLPVSTAVTWGVRSPGNPGVAEFGFISSTGLYTAPTLVPAGALNPIPVYVASQEDPSKSAIAMVTITNVAPLTISTTSLANSVANSVYSAALSASGGTQPYAWSVSTGSLPAGLSLHASTGAISGTPTAAGTTNFTVSVTDQSPTPQTQTANLSITVIPQLSITTTSLSNGEVGSTYNSTLNATGGVTPYTWTLTSGSLPQGLSLNATTGAITGTPATGSAGAFPISVKVTDSGTPQQTQTLATALTVSTPLSFTTTALPNDLLGTAYSQPVVATGGTSPYTFSLASGSGPLPPPLAINPTTGAITGTPSTAGAYTFTVQVSDSSTPAQSKTQALSISIYTVLILPSVTLPGGLANTAYSTALVAASGGTSPYTYSLAGGSGPLPPSLALNTTNGLISGTPTTPGSYPFSVQVKDSSSPAQTKVQALSITINSALGITSTSLANAVIGTAYSAAVTATGGTAPYTFSLATGSTAMPAWATLNASTGAITGLPALPAVTSTFTVQVTDASSPTQTKTQSLSITTYTALAINTTTLVNGVVGSSYNASVGVSGGTSPYTYSLVAGSGSLPPPLALNSYSGAITGTPTTGGTSNFSVKVVDSSSPAQTQTQALGITINPLLSINTTVVPSGTVNSIYSATLHSTGGVGTITWSVSPGTLPAGLSLSASGTISGIPTSAATPTITVTATDSGTPQQAKTQILSITINPVLSIGTSTLPNGTAGSPYSQNIATTGGTPTVSWSVPPNTLPPGLLLQGNPSGVGVISGTPSSAGSYTFTVTASDASTPQQNVTQQYTVVIVAPFSVTTTSLPDDVVSTPYSEPLQASGGTAPYTWSVTPGSSLPSWLSISGSGTSWTISGTPTSTGPVSFSLTVTDSSSPSHLSANQALNFAVNSGAGVPCADSGSESLLSGQYAFSLSGYESTGYLALLGSFTADGQGGIAGGIVDSNGILGVQSATIDATRSSYSVGSNHLGCATIATSFGTFTTRLALSSVTPGVAAAGRMMEWDAPTSIAYFAGTGQFMKQSVPSNLPSGSYAYESTGIYGTSQSRTGVIGMVTADATAHTFTYGEYDINVNGVVNGGAGLAAPFTGITGSYTAPDLTTGRYTTATTLNSVTTNHVAYLVSSSQYLEMSADALSTNTSILIGQGQLQNGTITANSLNGNAVYYLTGQAASGTSGGSADIGLATGTLAPNSLAISDYSVDSGVWSTPTPQIFNCTYAVDGYGRLTLSGSSNCTSGAPVMYVSGQNAAFMLSPSSTVQAGQMVPQVVPSGGFSSSMSSTYYFGDGEIVSYGVAQIEQIGVNILTLTSGGGFSILADYTQAVTGNQVPDVLDGPGTLSINADGTFSGSPGGTIIGIMISTTDFVLIDNDIHPYPIIEVAKQ